MTKFIKLSDIRNAQYDTNIENYGDFEDTCICCGKRTKSTIFIQLTTDNELTNYSDELPNSKGWFPIDSYCLKKFESFEIFI